MQRFLYSSISFSCAIRNRHTRQDSRTRDRRTTKTRQTDGQIDISTRCGRQQQYFPKSIDEKRKPIKNFNKWQQDKSHVTHTPSKWPMHPSKLSIRPYTPSMYYSSRYVGLLVAGRNTKSAATVVVVTICIAANSNGIYRQPHPTKYKLLNMPKVK